MQLGLAALQAFRARDPLARGVGPRQELSSLELLENPQ